MNPGNFRRLEGVAVLAASLAAYFALGGPVWLLLVLALAPDLSMVGYLAGNRVGAVVYNFGHVYALPLALGGFGLWYGSELAVLGALVWAGHVGADRLVGYGLKYDTGFGDTDLTANVPEPGDPDSAASAVGAGAEGR